MSKIVLENVSKVYAGDVRAVDDVSLTIESGEFMVLVGPSGCGKSTLLRMIAGLEDVTEGAVLIGDRDVTHLAPRNRDIAMVFQNYALYPHMTVRKNLAYGLMVRKTPKNEINRRVADVAKMLGLEPYLDRRPANLSGGQRQRVAMGRAIVREPAAYLMDEPLSNLDAKLRVGMRAELSRLHERLGTTTVYVTHDQIEAMTLGQRVTVMKDGVIQQVGEPQALYRNPANLFVAAFMGSPSMNLVEATVTGDSVEFAGFRLPLAPEWRPAQDGPVILGIRPGDFEDVGPCRHRSCRRSKSTSPCWKSSARSRTSSSGSMRLPSRPTRRRGRTTRRSARNCSPTINGRCSLPRSTHERPLGPASGFGWRSIRAAFHFFDPGNGSVACGHRERASFAGASAVEKPSAETDRVGPVVDEPAPVALPKDDLERARFRSGRRA